MHQALRGAPHLPDALMPHPDQWMRLDRHRRVNRPHTALKGASPASRATNQPG